MCIQQPSLNVASTLNISSEHIRNRYKIILRELSVETL